MKLLKTAHHPATLEKENLSCFTRLSTRAIVLDGSKILLLYTERYEDYSLPGGGLNEGESPEEGLRRELTEETGAKNIRDLKAFGRYEEYRPWYKDDFDIVYMISYCYSCSIDKELDAPQYESYEKANGMRPVWIELDEAINHNLKTLQQSQKKGLSIEREIFLLQKIQETVT